MRTQRRDWQHEIDMLNLTKSGTRRFVLTNSVVAQVTRCRLLAAYDNLEAETKGSTLILRVAA